MIFKGKFRILKNSITACDYDYILRAINDYKQKNSSILISPIASHTLVHVFFDREFQKALDSYDFLVSDSQWVRKSINFLYNAKLNERIYGPELMLKTCKLAEEKKYNIFLYGTTEATLNKLVQNLRKRFPKIAIVGHLPSKFAPLTHEEKKELGQLIEKRRTDILFVGLGEPLQEMFVYELFKEYKFTKPLTVITVGAAFDFIAGVKPQAPKWMGDLGFEWLFRLIHEPGRLWKRYLFYGPLFILLIITQKISMLFNPPHHKPLKEKVWG